MAKSKCSDAVEILRRRFVDGDGEMEALVRQERDNLNIAQQLYNARIGAGLTQQQLADRVGTTASVVCRLEDADYEGHSLNTLRRISAALDCRLEVRPIHLNGQGDIGVIQGSFGQEHPGRPRYLMIRMGGHNEATYRCPMLIWYTTAQAKEI
jgi:transcriptional regulator with XRE-family HTH domain